MCLRVRDLNLYVRAFILCVCVGERDCVYYIIIQINDVGLHSRRHPV